MTSMTGYAYEEVSTQMAVVSVEIKSVNSRFLDLNINLPPFLNQLESYYRNKICEKIVRGKVDVFIRVKELENDVTISVDKALAKTYYDAMLSIVQELKMTALNNEAAQKFIFTQAGVLNSNKTYNVDKYEKMITPVFEKSLSKFIADREREGENMKKDLEEKLLKLEKCAEFFKEYQPKMENEFKNQITSRFKDILSDNNYAVDENRIMTETAAMVVKYTINEEIVRLFSHIEAMKSEMKNNKTPGKKIDFICQEMNREINTIGSKNQFSQVGAMVIEAKDSLENIREQAKNVE